MFTRDWGVSTLGKEKWFWRCSLIRSIDANLQSAGNLPDADEVISVTREKSAAVGAPGNRDTFGVTGLSLVDLVEFRAKLINQRLVLEVPNLDGRSGGSAKPVAVGREGNGIDDITGLKRVEVLGVVQVPKHHNTILTSGSAKRTIGRHGDSVDVAVVTDEVGAKLELRKIPNLDDLVPTTGDDDRVGRVGREANARNPVRVTVLSELELALAKSVPELDGLVTGTGDDLAVVGRE